MNYIKSIAFTALLTAAVTLSYAQEKIIKAPIMGWSSWNNFRIHINEKMIREQADAMISSGLYDAGYRNINIDDGFFGGRDRAGKLYVDSAKFPSGMRAISDYIHSKGLKAGIYSEGGANTCGSMYDADKKGIGVGFFGHEQQDAQLYFGEWNFDFIKVDWCGGQQQKLSEKDQYTKIIEEIRKVKPSAGLNICRWQFPGEWAIKLVDSWRVSQDIVAKYTSVLHIIDINRDLHKYASAGHYNDMDMLQVGRGMSYDEDKTHFSMWCMLNSPLLAGNDLRSMSKETIEILTNREVIALNQDPAFVQGYSVLREGDIEVWLKPLASKGKKKSQAIAIMNRGDVPKSFTLDATKLALNKKAKVRDLWQHKNLGKLGKARVFDIPKHGIVIIRIEG